ncbi:hypothetical protein DSL72_000397 [Monilinia vaccinii-corymbosi]|uniref:Homeobox domain-containing protein n=1 Tax=Monilinia vaccinii-corymbosi TaxID=61207 RepID=A0A8A3P9J3_9HELO|nr:hypothetical protein DSL72_000397 [Monilinia vaccinii-corymbosi]
MPKDAQHAIWLNNYYLGFPATPKPWQGMTQAITDACNAAHVPPTTQGVDRVDSQTVARHFRDCRARAENTPRAFRMTPEQKQVLQQAYEIDHYPSPGARMVIMQRTGLNYKQVKKWFEYKASILNKARGPSGHTAPKTPASKMWREHNADTEGYVQKLLNGSIDHTTGIGGIVPARGILPIAYAQLPSTTAQSTSGNLYAPSVQPSHGQALGSVLQSAQHPGQAGLHPMQTQVHGQINHHGLGGFQGMQNHQQMQAQSLRNNMHPSSRYGSYQSLSGYDNGGMPVHQQPSISSDQFVPQSYPDPEEPQYQWQDPYAFYPPAQQSQTEQPHNESWEEQDSAAPSRKRKVARAGDDMENSQQYEKRPRTSPSASTPALPPFPDEPNNTWPYWELPHWELPQATSHNEPFFPPGKRKLASIGDGTENMGQSTKGPRTARHSREDQRQNVLEIEGVEHSNGSRPGGRLQSPKSPRMAEKRTPETASNVTGQSGDLSSDLEHITRVAEQRQGVESADEAQSTQEEDNPATLGRFPSPAAHSPCSKDGERELDTGEDVTELPSQEPSSLENLAPIQPATLAGALKLEDLLAQPGIESRGFTSPKPKSSFE